MRVLALHYRIFKKRMSQFIFLLQQQCFSEQVMDIDQDLLESFCLSFLVSDWLLKKWNKCLGIASLKNLFNWVLAEFFDLEWKTKIVLTFNCHNKLLFLKKDQLLTDWYFLLYIMKVPLSKAQLAIFLCLLNLRVLY